MQKALVVRTAAGTQPASQSHEVDPQGSAATNLSALLSAGWRVSHTCAMPGELDSCCLVVVERADAAPADPPLASLSYPKPAPRPAADKWDGETLPLAMFGLG